MSGKHKRPPEENMELGLFLGPRLIAKTKASELSDVERYYRDTVEIIKPRCFVRMERRRRVMEEYGMPLPTEDVHFEFILEREMMGYQLEQGRQYKKKFPKSSYIRDIFDADTKNTSLFKIISFDRAWLFTERVKERVLRAQEEGDHLFFMGLGDAIAKEPKIKPLRAAPPGESAGDYQRVLDFAEAYIDSRRANSSDMKLPRRSILDLHDLLLKKYETWVPFSLSVDPVYFRKFLERNSIIPSFQARKKLEALKTAPPSSSQEK